MKMVFASMMTGHGSLCFRFTYYPFELYSYSSSSMVLLVCQDDLIARDRLARGSIVVCFVNLVAGALFSLLNFK